MERATTMRPIDMPSPETIAMLSRTTVSTPEEIKAVLKQKAKLEKIRSFEVVEPNGRRAKLVNPRSGRSYRTKSVAFGGTLAKYLEARDMRGYKREYARLWRQAGH
jgi:hypothetical protein